MAIVLTSNAQHWTTTKMIQSTRPVEPDAKSSKTWMCLVCGWIYDEAVGSPDDDIAPGTKWEDVPISWSCPECGARKEDFEMVEI
jgi:rubredoxin